ncbi:MAG: PEP-CTERM sorting domain-containing protein [Sedimentisphaerales bacterium]|nr:PEP-CTERM sorting domain-containing protein [Sedimentisphaerales bacterium]
MKYVVIIIEYVVLILGITSVAMAVPNSNSIIEDGIEYYIQTDKSVYDLGENVEMHFKVINLTDEVLYIQCYRSGPFNLLVEKNDESVWAAAHWFAWDLPVVELAPGESKGPSYIWDMVDDNDNLIAPGIYDVIGVIYNAYTEVAVPITIVPEPATILLLSLGAGLMVRMRRSRTSR